MDRSCLSVATQIQFRVSQQRRAQMDQWFGGFDSPAHPRLLEARCYQMFASALHGPAPDRQARARVPRVVHALQVPGKVTRLLGSYFAGRGAALAAWFPGLQLPE